MKTFQLSNKADLVSAVSWYRLIEKALPEQREVVMRGCISCGQKCERLCSSGEYVAWGLAQIQVNMGAEFN